MTSFANPSAKTARDVGAVPGDSFPPRDVLVMAPHPDDEILGCGTLMRRVSAAGGRVVIAWLTDGGGSHGVLDPDLRKALVDQRRDEALAGVEALGIRPVATCFLGFEDGFLDHSIDAAREQLEALRRRHDLDAGVVTAADDDHPDHRAAFGIAATLGFAHLYSYPVSARYDGAGYAPPVGAILLHPDTAEAKRTALLRHRSQAPGGGAIHPMSDAAIDRFCDEPEIFIPARTSGS